MQKRNNKIFELGVSVFLMLASMYMFWIAVTTDKPVTDGNLSAMAFPKVLYLVIIVLCAYLIVNGIIWLKKHPADPSAEKVAMVPKKSIITFVLIVAYAALWKVIGCSLSTLLFFFTESYILDRKRPLWLTVLLAVAATVIMYVVFGMFFKVSFPDKLMDMVRGF